MTSEKNNLKTIQIATRHSCLKIDKPITHHTTTSHPQVTKEIIYTYKG